MGAAGKQGFPLARREGLLAEEVGAETVLYDGGSREAHCLTPLAAVVFARSDGRTPPADLAAIASGELGDPVDVEVIEQALAELEARDLLVASPDGDGISRRQMFGRTAKVGGAAFAAPLVYSVLTPAYGAAATAPPPSQTDLSHVSACFVCNGETYSMKWEWDDNTEALVELCGEGHDDPTCGSHLACADAEDNDDECVPGGSTIVENSDFSVTFTFPTNCELTDFVFKGNCQEGGCTSGDCCTNPAPGDLLQLPSSGNQTGPDDGSGVYKTVLTCT